MFGCAPICWGFDFIGNDVFFVFVFYFADVYLGIPYSMLKCSIAIWGAYKRIDLRSFKICRKIMLRISGPLLFQFVPPFLPPKIIRDFVLKSYNLLEKGGFVEWVSEI